MSASAFSASDFSLGCCLAKVTHIVTYDIVQSYECKISSDTSIDGVTTYIDEFFSVITYDLLLIRAIVCPGFVVFFPTLNFLSFDGQCL